MASRLTLILLLSALVLLSALQPTHLIARQSRCSRHQVVVLKVPSKKKSGTAKGAKKPAGFAKRSAPPKPATALPKGSWETLRSWLKDRGAKVGGVVAEEVLPPSRARGLLARQPRRVPASRGLRRSRKEQDRDRRLLPTRRRR